MIRPDDTIFIALARKVGFPPEAQLRELRVLQLAAMRTGQSPWLYDLACSRGLLDAEKQRRFEQWTEQALAGQGQAPPQPVPRPAPEPVQRAAPVPPPMPRASGPVPKASGSIPKASPLPRASGPIPRVAPLPVAPAPPAQPAAVASPEQPAAPAPPAQPDPAHPPSSRRSRLVTPSRHKTAAASGKQRALRGTPSGGAASASPKAAGKPSSKSTILIVAGVVLALAAVGVAGAVALTGSTSTDSTKDETVPPTTPPVTPPPVVAPHPVPPPPADSQPTGPAGQALAALKKAEKFEEEEHEADALLALDLPDPPSGPVRDQIEELRERLTGRVRGLLDDGARAIENLIADGRSDEAAETARKLRVRLPAALIAQLDARIAKATEMAKDSSKENAETARRDREEEEAQEKEWARRRKEREAAAAGRKDGDAGRKDGDSPGPAAPSPGPAATLPPPNEEARYVAAVRRLTSRAYFLLLPGDAKAILAQVPPLGGRSEEAMAAEREMTVALNYFAQAVFRGFKQDMKKLLRVDFRDGLRAHLKLVLANEDGVIFRSPHDDQSYLYGDLASWFLLDEARKAEAPDREKLALGAATLLTFRQRKHLGLEQLAMASKSSKAVPFLQSILEDMDDDDPFLEAAAGLSDASSEDRGAGTGQVFDPKKLPLNDDKPLPSDRKMALDAARKAGNWLVAYSSKHYDFFSNGSLDQVKDLAGRMDLMFDGYRRILDLKSDPKRPLAVCLYRSCHELQQATKVPDGVAGFYDGEKVVACHGNSYTLTTEKVLLHEGAHQFERLAFGDDLSRVGVWFLEGLAVYFEAAQIDAHGLTDVIPQERLRVVQRAIKSGDYVPLSDLVSLDAQSFSGLHYAHAWSLIYFLSHGTDGGPERLTKCYEGLKAGKDGGKVLEEVFNKPLGQIEDAWKAYVLQLR